MQARNCLDFRANLIIWARPNAGLPVMRDGMATYDVTPEQMAASAVRTVKAGARIAAIAAAVKS